MYFPGPLFFASVRFVFLGSLRRSMQWYSSIVGAVPPCTNELLAISYVRTYNLYIRRYRVHTPCRVLLQWCHTDGSDNVTSLVGCCGPTSPLLHLSRGPPSHCCSAATLKELWSPDAADGDYRDEMAVATYIVQVASHVARELQEELCRAEAIRSEIGNIESTSTLAHWYLERK